LSQRFPQDSLAQGKLKIVNGLFSQVTKNSYQTVMYSYKENVNGNKIMIQSKQWTEIFLLSRLGYKANLILIFFIDSQLSLTVKVSAFTNTKPKTSKVLRNKVAKTFGIGLETTSRTLKATTKLAIRQTLHPIHKHQLQTLPS
jgi:hypothetical protein